MAASPVEGKQARIDAGSADIFHVVLGLGAWCHRSLLLSGGRAWAAACARAFVYPCGRVVVRLCGAAGRNIPAASFVTDRDLNSPTAETASAVKQLGGALTGDIGEQVAQLGAMLDNRKKGMSAAERSDRSAQTWAGVDFGSGVSPRSACVAVHA